MYQSTVNSFKKDKKEIHDNCACGKRKESEQDFYFCFIFLKYILNHKQMNKNWFVVWEALVYIVHVSF